MASPDPTFTLGEAYEQAMDHLGDMTEFELGALAGSLVAEFVNRGYDTKSALDKVVAAARGGAEGSRLFDQMEP